MKEAIVTVDGVNYIVYLKVEYGHEEAIKCFSVLGFEQVPMDSRGQCLIEEFQEAMNHVRKD